MIHVLLGENQFRIDAALRELTQGADEVRRLDGVTLTRSELVEAVYGVSLFASERVVIIDELSRQRSLWDSLPELLKDPTDVTVIFAEPNLDKRLKTYKWLTQHTKIIDCEYLEANNTRAAETWARDYATNQNVVLSGELAAEMVRRALRTDPGSKRPIIDQQLLATALTQLSGSGEVTRELIDTVLAPSSYENVFELLGLVLDGSVEALSRVIDHMRRHDDAYMVTGLLASQLTQLTALVLARGEVSIEQIAKDTKAHPYALRSLQRYAGRLTRQDLAWYVSQLAQADGLLKTTSNDPWLVVDVALTKMANYEKTTS